MGIDWPRIAPDPPSLRIQGEVQACILGVAAYIALSGSSRIKNNYSSIARLQFLIQNFLFYAVLIYCLLSLCIGYTRLLNRLGKSPKEWSSLIVVDLWLGLFLLRLAPDF